MIRFEQDPDDQTIVLVADEDGMAELGATDFADVAEDPGADGLTRLTLPADPEALDRAIDALVTVDRVAAAELEALL